MINSIFSLTNRSWILFEEEPIENRVMDQIERLEKTVNAKNLTDEGLKELAINLKKMANTSKNAEKKAKHKERFHFCMNLIKLRNRLKEAAFAIYNPDLYRNHIESFREDL